MWKVEMSGCSQLWRPACWMPGRGRSLGWRPALHQHMRRSRSASPAQQTYRVSCRPPVMSSYSQSFRRCSPGSKGRSIANRKEAMGQIREEQRELLQSPLIAGKVECAQNSASVLSGNAWLTNVSLGPLANCKALMIRDCLQTNLWTWKLGSGLMVAHS